MRCVECQQFVEDYFDGELDEQTTLQVAEHLDACASCQSAYALLEKEQALFLSYECETQPAPDFWDNVIARTAQENTKHRAHSSSSLRGWFSSALGRFNAPRLSPSLAALLVLLAIGTTIAVMRYLNSREESVAPATVARNEAAPAPVAAQPGEIIKPSGTATPERDEAVGMGRGRTEVKDQPPQVAKIRAGKKERVLAASLGNEKGVRVNPSAGTAGRPQTSDELVREAEQKYVAAIAMLSRDASRRRSRLDAETAARFAQTLAAVDRTIADTRRAARRHPGDPVAAQYMLTAYAKKVDVLREIVSY